MHLAPDVSFISRVIMHTGVGTLAGHRLQGPRRIMRYQDGSGNLGIARGQALSA